jgi:AcrR family transcriptional regulator
MSAPLNRTQKRQKETRERIFRVAMALFREKGFENTTVAEISEAADVGKGTFFTYFPTKEAIFRQPGEMAIQQMAQLIQEGTEAGRATAVILKETLTASADWHEANKAITLQMIRSSFSLDIRTDNKGKLFELLVQLIRAAQEKGEFDQAIDARDAAVVLAGVYFTVIAVWAAAAEFTLPEARTTEPDAPLFASGHSLAARMEAAVDVILKGLLA